MRFVNKSNTSKLVLDAKSRLSIAKTYSSDPKVKEILRRLYSGCCAFCECSPEDGSYFHIEHFYPKGKRKYKGYVKMIENLHYSCQRCNTIKSTPLHMDIFSPNYYLDAQGNWKLSLKKKLTNEIFYKGHLLFSKNVTPLSIDRGQKTIELFDLNNKHKKVRRSLVERRLRLFRDVNVILSAVFDLVKYYDPNQNSAIDSLFAYLISFTKPSSHYSTMVIQNFGNDIYNLLSVYYAKKK